MIRKPAYQLTLTPEPLAVIVGTAVEWTATATFFDGTPAASVPLVFRDPSAGIEREVTTDATGTASVSLTAKASDLVGGRALGGPGTPGTRRSHRPGPEAGEIYGQATVLVFPTADSLVATGTLTQSSSRSPARSTWSTSRLSAAPWPPARGRETPMARPSRAPRSAPPSPS